MGDASCPCCSGKDLKHYDTVKRIIRTKAGATTWVRIRRIRCVNCGAVHRELPDYILPYKQYETEVILGVLDGLITSDTLGYEDYPCEMTMSRWLKQTHRDCFNNQ
ncbi:MAG: DUF6431 domain-containing protein [Oscillospiraceae bacterium]|nr:DUF6431 domain-containing protein [Oscillospiraceae bacterium]